MVDSDVKIKLFANEAKPKKNRSNKSQAKRLKTAMTNDKNGRPSDAQLWRKYNSQTVPMLAPSLQPSNNDIIQSLQEIIQSLHQSPVQSKSKTMQKLDKNLDVSNADMKNEIINVLEPDNVSRRLLPQLDEIQEEEEPTTPPKAKSKGDLMYVMNSAKKQAIGQTPASSLVPDALRMSTPISEVFKRQDAAQVLKSSAKRALTRSNAISEKEAAQALLNLGNVLPASLNALSPARSPALSRAPSEQSNIIPRDLMIPLGRVEEKATKDKALRGIQAIIRQKQARDKWTEENANMKRTAAGKLDQRIYRVPNSKFDLKEKVKEAEAKSNRAKSNRAKSS